MFYELQVLKSIRLNPLFEMKLLSLFSITYFGLHRGPPLLRCFSDMGCYYRILKLHNTRIKPLTHCIMTLECGPINILTGR